MKRGKGGDPNAGPLAYIANLAKAASGRRTAAGLRMRSALTRRPRVVIFGDSFVLGTGAAKRRGYAQRLSGSLTADVAALGSGGTGFILGCGQGTHYQGRLRHLVLAKPHVAVIQASINDHHLEDWEVIAAATDFFVMARHALKSTRFVLVGPIWYLDPCQLERLRSLIEKVAVDLGLEYIDPTGWIDESTALVLMSQDRIHPSDAGHGVIATNLSRPLQMALVSTSMYSR